MSPFGQDPQPGQRRRLRQVVALLALVLFSASALLWLPQSQAAPEVAEPLPPPHRPYDPIEVDPVSRAASGESPEATAGDEPDAPVTGDPTDSLRPQVAADVQGNLHVVWHEGEGDGNNGVKYAKGTFNGAVYVWSAPVDVWQPGGFYGYVYPRLTVDNQNRVHVVWTWGGSIYYKNWDANAGPGQGSQPIVLGRGIYPSIAASDDNHLHVVWEEDFGGQFEVQYREFTGQGFTTARNISNTAENSLSPDVAVDTNGEVHVVWYEGNTANRIAYTRRVGTAWQTVQRISFAYSYFPSIQADNAGCVHMSWVTIGSLSKAVYRKVCAGQFVDSREVGNANVPHAAVGASPGGRAIVAWDSNPAPTQIYYSQVINGQSSPAAKLLPTPGRRQYWPDATSLPNGSIVVVWQEDGVNGRFDPAYALVPCPGAPAATASQARPQASTQATQPQQLQRRAFFPLIYGSTLPPC